MNVLIFRAGQERFRSLTTAFYRDAFGFLLIFDITNEKSFLDVQDWIEQLKIHAYCEDPEIILVGNKKDSDYLRVVSASRAQHLAEKYGIPYIETSAATGENVANSIEMLLDRVMKRMETSVLKEQILAVTGYQADGNGHEKNDRIKIVDLPEKSKCNC